MRQKLIDKKSEEMKPTGRAAGDNGGVFYSGADNKPKPPYEPTKKTKTSKA